MKPSQGSNINANKTESKIKDKRRWNRVKDQGWSQVSVLKHHRHLDRSPNDAQVIESCVQATIWHEHMAKDVKIAWWEAQTVDETPGYPHHMTLSWSWTPWDTLGQELSCNRMIPPVSLPGHFLLILVCSFWNIWQQQLAFVVILHDLKFSNTFQHPSGLFGWILHLVWYYLTWSAWTTHPIIYTILHKWLPVCLLKSSTLPQKRL